MIVKVNGYIISGKIVDNGRIVEHLKYRILVSYYNKTCVT